MKIFPSSYHITSFVIFVGTREPICGLDVYTGMYRNRCNTYYFNSLMVSTIDSRTKLWVGLSKSKIFVTK